MSKSEQLFVFILFLYNNEKTLSMHSDYSELSDPTVSYKLPTDLSNGTITTKNGTQNIDTTTNVPQTELNETTMTRDPLESRDDKLVIRIPGLEIGNSITFTAELKSTDKFYIGFVLEGFNNEDNKIHIELVCDENDFVIRTRGKLEEEKSDPSVKSVLTDSIFTLKFWVKEFEIVDIKLNEYTITSAILKYNPSSISFSGDIVEVTQLNWCLRD